MDFKCVECSAVTTVNAPITAKQFVCPNCRKSYFWSEEGFRLGKQFEKTTVHTRLDIGLKGFLKGQELTVTGSVTKQVYGQFYWEEYTLVDAKGSFFYLSQSEGHFILLQEIEAKFPFDGRHHITHEEIEYKIYEKPKARIVDASGFFDEELPTAEVKMMEYIAPPYTISIERSNNENRYYKGEHVSRRQIKKAFPNFDMPVKSGVGMIQPFPVDLKNLILTLCATAILTGILHIFIYRNQSEQSILATELPFSDFDGKQFTSPSFELVGGSAPLSIAISAPVDNSWANLSVVLVDEKSNDEIEASKDVEYYHGYTDGESWSEGAQSEDFNICGVGAGKYHLVLSPMKEVSAQPAGSMGVNVVWNQPSLRNVWFTALFMAIFVAVIYFIRYQFEKKRWSESDYSDYE
ncbi:DUF4178 domain-containing protein [Flavobacterium sp.]|uniref:DUF4178 domain-containing protein n=1 Tax=Flavobacterium sp. TaxID=239 RepID=UPI00120F989B|nr:DUF4178 domain-containing protein [Flavobacterium sp.]RZJ69337.1 MAG: DUF4178 domain-containing protein [Flavobacterium sp.]